MSLIYIKEIHESAPIWLGGINLLGSLQIPLPLVMFLKQKPRARQGFMSCQACCALEGISRR